MSSGFSATIARIRRRLPSKRKLDDCAPLGSSLPSSVAMKKPFPISPSPPSSSSSSSSPSHHSLSSSSSSASSSSSTLHFFVRTNSKTIVIHASPSDTIASVIRLITGGSPSSDHLLIYGGRQLDPDSTLASSSVENDVSLHLTARLRSTRFPRAWSLVHDLVKSVDCLINGSPPPREISHININSVIAKFLTCAPAAEIEDAVVEYLQVFTLGCAPAELVKLYISRSPTNKATAESAIKLFLNPAPDFLPKVLQIQCWSIVLQFCQMIAGTDGTTDRLYVLCRSTLGSLLAARDCSQGGNLVVVEAFPFVQELAGIILTGLSSESMLVPESVLGEFANFVAAIRRAIKDCLGGTGQIPKSLLDNIGDPRFKPWIPELHAIYMELLAKVDASLKKVHDFTAESSPLLCGPRLAIWSQVLVVLTNIHRFSKIYEGAPQLLHDILLHRRVPINALVRSAKRNVDLRWLLKYKDVTDFDSRRYLALMLFPEGKDDYENLHEMLIDRSQLLSESFEYISQVDADALHGGLFMEFKDEEATGPGVLREWFCSVCQAIFNPQHVLFVPCPNDRRRFYPNPASGVDPLHLKYFSFCGRVIGLALMHKVQVGVVFDRSFFSQLAGKMVTLEDVKDADPFLYMSCKKILEMDAELLDSDVLGLTFVREVKELGTHQEVELCPGGKDIMVNSKNREEYINLMIQHRFMTSISEQVTHFARGFTDIFSNRKFHKIFFNSLDLEDFDRMIGGSDATMNVRDWKANTEYKGYKEKDRQICWFWKIVGGMPEEQQRTLLFFWTSVKYLPVDGFGGLASKLYIYKASDSHDRLPTSHTCFYRLCLPAYPSISVMRAQLQFITQEHVSCTFGMW